MCACVLRAGPGSHFTKAAPQWRPRTAEDTLHDAVKEITGECSVFNQQKSDALDCQRQLHVHVQAFTSAGETLPSEEEQEYRVEEDCVVQDCVIQEEVQDCVVEEEVSASDCSSCLTISCSDDGSAAPSGHPTWRLMNLDTPFRGFIPMHSEDADDSDDEECESQEALPLEKVSAVCGFEDAVGACTFQETWPWCVYPWTEYDDPFKAYWVDNLPEDVAARYAATRRFSSSLKSGSGVSVVRPPVDPSLLLPWDM